MSDLQSKFRTAFMAAIPSINCIPSTREESLQTYIMGGFVKIHVEAVGEDMLVLSVPVYKVQSKEFDPLELRFLVTSAQQVTTKGRMSIKNSQIVMIDMLSSDILDNHTDFCQYIDCCLKSYWSVRKKLLNIKEDYTRRDLKEQRQLELIQPRVRTYIKAGIKPRGKRMEKKSILQVRARPNSAREIRSTGSSTQMLSSASSLPSRQSTISTLGWSSQKNREFRKTPASPGMHNSKFTAKHLFPKRRSSPVLSFPSGTSDGSGTSSSKSRKGTKRSLSASSSGSSSKSEYLAWWSAKGKRSSTPADQGDRVARLPEAPDLMAVSSSSKENRPPLRPRRASTNRSPLRSFRKSAAGPPPLTLARIGSSSPISLKKRFHPQSIADGAKARTAGSQTGNNTSDSAEETASPKWWKPVRAPSLEPAAPTRKRSPTSKRSVFVDAPAIASPQSVGSFPESKRKADPPKWWKPVRAPSQRRVPAPNMNQLD